MKYIIFTIYILLAGCSSLKNFSKNEKLPLELQLGTKILTEEVCLFPDPSGFFRPDIDVWLLVNIRGVEGCKGSNLLETIHKGESIEIEKLVKHTGYGLFIVERWFVIGYYGKGESKIKFSYQLPWLQDTNDSFTEYDIVPWANGL